MCCCSSRHAQRASKCCSPGPCRPSKACPATGAAGSRGSHAGESSVLRARVAIDAHGSWQALPSARQVQRRTPRGSDLLAFKANFRDADLVDGLLPVLAFDGGYGGMVVADGGLTTVACCIRRDRLGRLPWRRLACAPARPSRPICERSAGGVREALQAATRVGPWLAAGPLNPGIRVDAHDGPFRIGNAAGEAHPIIGEGMSMALQSAWLLTRLPACRAASRTARRWRSSATVARRYAAHWRRQFAPRLLFAAGFAHLAMRPRTQYAAGRLWRSAWPRAC